MGHMLRKIGTGITVFALATAWLFSGWPQIQVGSFVFPRTTQSLRMAATNDVLCAIYRGSALQRVIVPQDAAEIPIVCKGGANERVEMLHADTAQKPGEDNIAYATRMVQAVSSSTPQTHS